jgi:shikimate kinase
MMSGIAASRGAVTIVNAIATGRGAALGISLETLAQVDLEPGEGALDVDCPADGMGLVTGCIEAVAKKAGAGPVRGRAVLKSEIPISRGLKSSSAASNATTLAAARALGIDLTDEELLGMAVDESIKAGVTVTGAFDDASACLLGGVVVTDNSARRILGRDKVDEDLVAIIHVPDRRISKESIDRGRFANEAHGFEEALSSAMRGDYRRAMELNSKATARALDLSDSLADAARRGGAYAAGITGTGPATVILCRPSQGDEMKAIASGYAGEVLEASLNDTCSREVTPRPL